MVILKNCWRAEYGLVGEEEALGGHSFRAHTHIHWVFLWEPLLSLSEHLRKISSLLYKAKRKSNNCERCQNLLHKKAYFQVKRLKFIWKITEHSPVLHLYHIKRAPVQSEQMTAERAGRLRISLRKRTTYPKSRGETKRYQRNLKSLIHKATTNIKYTPTLSQINISPYTKNLCTLVPIT